MGGSWFRVATLNLLFVGECAKCNGLWCPTNPVGIIIYRMQVLLVCLGVATTVHHSVNGKMHIVSKAQPDFIKHVCLGSGVNNLAARTAYSIQVSPFLDVFFLTQTHCR